MSYPEEGKEVYIGDGVYVTHDGYQLWLRTGDGNNQRIALEPACVQALVAYARQFNGYFIPNTDRPVS